MFIPPAIEEAVVIGSQDNTSNTPIDGDVFSELRSVLTANISDPKFLPQVLTAIDDMRAVQGQAGFADAFQKFIALCDGRMGVVGPYVSKLAEMIK